MDNAYHDIFDKCDEADRKLAEMHRAGLHNTPEFDKQLKLCNDLRSRRQEHCPRCGKDTGEYVEERYSCGYYAGKMCDPCWADSGYRDADDRIDYLDAGEHEEPEETYRLDDPPWKYEFGSGL